MTAGEICKKLELEVICESAPEKEVKGCYCSDLLSHCMSNISDGNVWITVQTNINIAAIAVLTDLGCIIIAQNMPIEDAVVDKAHAEGINIYRSNKNAYELCVEVGKLI